MKHEWKGIRIRVFNTCMILVSCVLYIFLLMATIYAADNYEQLVVTTSDYIRLEDTAKDILKASDYLTEQVRLYVQTLEPEHARLYFEEANVTRRRENALTVMREHSLDPQREDSLKQAVSYSDELMIREMYAMKLVVAAEGHTGGEIPREVTDVALEPADMGLDRQEKLEKARSMLFDQEYQDMKSKIYTHLECFTQGVLSTTEHRLGDGLDGLLNSIHTQRLLLSVLAILNVVTFLVITLLVVRPLKIFLSCIQNRSLIRPAGAYEFKYLAKVYNEIYMHSDSLEASEAFLRKKAEHDALTGIMNRYMFQQISELLHESGVPIALVLIDVDKFKDVNDTYGHAGGDRVLIRVAKLLRESLRESDYVFRVGGDEFAAILTNVKKERLESVRRKLLQVNAQLLQPQEDCVAVSLSIGMAFSENGYREGLYEQADRALYCVKEHGRCDCMIYTAAMEEAVSDKA
ncbi:MAG: GGDEF domain-containing protein [Oscillospiraceae bacterium]|nr:GGDEF domain-containing protein [Oscillospiraceae bacterium]